MIKLIATDVDETLVPEGTTNPNPEYYRIFDELYKRGVVLCICSGRQIEGIKRTFPKAKNVNYVAGNGTYIEGMDFKKVFTFDDEEYAGLIDDLRNLPSDYYIMTDVDEVSYFEPKAKFFHDRMRDRYQYNCAYVDDIRSLKNVCKISVFNNTEIKKDVEEYLVKKYSGVMEASLAGSLFFDFMKKGCNKGRAIEEFQNYYGISPEETMAFGDSNNDYPMLKRAKYSYAVKGATDRLKSIATEVLGPMEEDSVLKKIMEVMAID